jgi:hypothetical protein
MAILWERMTELWVTCGKIEQSRILGEWLNIACFPKDEVAIHNMKSVDIFRL